MGRALLPLLRAQGAQVFSVSRRSVQRGDDLIYVFDAGLKKFKPALASVDVLISLAPLPFIDVVLDMALLLGARKVIAFGSTGRFSKTDSSSALERDFVIQQAQAEKLFAARSAQVGIAWTLFRPTMIYGGDADQSVAFVKAVVARFGVFPMPWGANGQRQPVHVGDLARACVSALQSDRTAGKAYDLGGGEVLRFEELVRRIFKVMGRRPLLLPVPLTLYRLVVQVARWIPSTRFVRKEMVDRMYQDLITDNGPAQRDFGYRPRALLPGQLSG